VQPGVDLSTSDGKAEASQEALKADPTPLSYQSGCKKLIECNDRLLGLQYDGDVVEDFFTESRRLEDKNLPPAAQPARDPLAITFCPV
jgi:hypothetical protein